MLPDGEKKSRELAEYYEAIAKRNHIYYLNPEGMVEVNTLDGIHYTEKGHQQMAALIEAKIRRIFR